MNTYDIWTADTWTKINGTPGDAKTPGLLKTVMGPMRIAQMIFPTVVQDNETPIPADSIDLTTGVPSTGLTKSFATIKKYYELFPIHVQDPKLTIAMNQVSLAGQSLALIEDKLYFQGKNALENLPKHIHIDNVDALECGLLGIAEKYNQVIPVFPCGVIPCGAKEEVRYGIATLAAVVKGIAQFSANLQGPPYSLILEPSIYGDANMPLEDDAIVTPASAIQAIIDKSDGHFMMSSGLPCGTGLLVSLGGMTTTLYVGTEPVIEPNPPENGKYTFTARESIQLHNIDHRSLIKLEFKPEVFREPKPK